MNPSPAVAGPTLDAIHPADTNDWKNLLNTIKQPRVALCGINLETNAFSPVSTEDDFRSLCYLEGEDMITDVRSDAPKSTQEVVGFVSAMDATGPWQPIPLVFAWCHPWGPVDQTFFDHMVEVSMSAAKSATLLA